MAAMKDGLNANFCTMPVYALMFQYCEPQKPPQVPLITIQMLSFDQNATFVYQILKLGFSTKIGITFLVMFERRYQYILNRKATLSQNSSHT